MHTLTFILVEQMFKSDALGVGVVTQGVKVLAAETDHASSIPGTHVAEEES